MPPKNYAHSLISLKNNQTDPPWPCVQVYFTGGFVLFINNSMKCFISYLLESEEHHVFYHLHRKSDGEKIGSVSAVTKPEAHRLFLKLLKDSRDNGKIDGYDYTQKESNKSDN